MGLFDKMKSGLKGITDRVTGGYGEVSVELENSVAEPGQAVRGKVKIVATAGLKVDALIITIYGTEATEVESKQRKDGQHERPFREKCQTVKFQEKLDQGLELSEGDEREIPIEIVVPEDAPPTFEGKHFSHTYILHVQVDVPWGVDLKTEAPLQVIRYKPDEQEKLSVEYSDPVFSAKLTVDKHAATNGELNYTVEWQNHTSEPRTYAPFCEIADMSERLFCTVYEETEEGERQTARDWSTETKRCCFYELINSRYPGRSEEVADDGMSGVVTGKLTLKGTILPSYVSENFKNEFILRVEPFDEEAAVEIPVCTPTIYSKRE